MTGVANEEISDTENRSLQEKMHPHRGGCMQRMSYSMDIKSPRPEKA
jgi:hypothetical protein